VRVLGARGGRPELADALREKQLEVDVVEAYDTVADEAAISRVAREHLSRPFDAIGFASPKGAQAFLSRVNPAAAKIGAIGQTTRAAVEEMGHAVHAIPEHPDLAALVDALAEKIE
jgi:uroporphyrinogen-III synthase